MTTTTTGRPVTIDYGCPDWCTRTDHYADDIETGEQAIHYGPDFERVSIQAKNDEPFGVYVGDGTDSVYVTGADNLRAIAADMVHAAEWMEAQA